MANKVTIKNKKILGIHKTSTKGSVGTKYLKIPSIPTIPLPQINNFVFPNFMNVASTSLNTTIENEFGVKVSTIEHLMGALFGLGIDNALIEIDNEEVPILDGSAKVFIEKIVKAGIEVHYLGYYLSWDPQECYYYAVDNTGFQANPERTEGTYSKYSSIDDKIDPFHYFTTLIKFGLGRCSYDASQEVRNGKITREEAEYLVDKYDMEFPHKYFKEFIQYMGISEDQFWDAVEEHRSPHIWKKCGNDWKLRHTAAKSGEDD